MGIWYIILEFLNLVALDVKVIICDASKSNLQS